MSWPLSDDAQRDHEQGYIEWLIEHEHDGSLSAYELERLEFYREMEKA